jgi:alpha-beta hydrolase superfamily lysophospholipase
MLDGMASEFRARGYDVYIGQARLAGRGANASGAGRENGIEQVLFEDFPAHLREVIRRNPGRAIHLLGHSMGGIEILGALSDARLASEFVPHIAAVTFVAAPHDFRALPLAVRLQARAILPLMRAARRIVGPKFGPHTSLVDFTQKLGLSRNPLATRLARSLEGVFIQLGNFILHRTLVSVNHTTPEAMRRLWVEEVSALPLDLLIDFAEGVKRGEFVGRDGRALIVPERITVPVQVIRALRDMLVPPERQRELYRRLGSKTKRLMDLEGMQHVDPVVTDRPESNFLGAAIDFHDAPAKAVEAAPHLIFHSATNECERYLRLPAPASSLQN